MRLSYSPTILALVTVACSARLHVTDISKAEPGSVIAGIPFKTRQSYRVAVYRRGQGGEYEEVFHDVMVMAHRSRTYAIRFDADFLSDSSLALNVNPDGTLTHTKLTSDPKADETIAALGEEFKKVQDARVQRETARSAARDSARTAHDAAEVAALDAMLEVEAAQIALDSLSRDASLAERQEAVARLQRARLQANIAYRALGRPEPFPDVTP